jgi:hypothetical protein
MPEYKTINVDPDTYDLIVKIAKISERTIGAQVRVLARWEAARMRIREVADGAEDEHAPNHDADDDD